MFPPKQFSTERLFFRPPKKRDATAIFESWSSDPEVCKFLAWSPHKTIKDTYKFIKFSQHARDYTEEFIWLIFLHNETNPIGSISIRPNKFRVEIGYVLGRQFWGNGYMTEAVTYLSNMTLAVPEVYRVWAVCDVDNIASARVLEKSGMLREGLLRAWSIHPSISNFPRDCWCYSKIKT
jgi:[ribosomal protein S5]-alanine N-acetyltransferase